MILVWFKWVWRFALKQSFLFLVDTTARCYIVVHWLVDRISEVGRLLKPKGHHHSSKWRPTQWINSITLLLAITKVGSKDSTSSSASSLRYMGLLISTFSWLCILTCMKGFPLKRGHKCTIYCIHLQFGILSHLRRLRMTVTAAVAAAIMTTIITSTTTMAVIVPFTDDLPLVDWLLELLRSLPTVWQRTP